MVAGWSCCGFHHLDELNRTSSAETGSVPHWGQAQPPGVAVVDRPLGVVMGNETNACPLYLIDNTS